MRSSDRVTPDVEAEAGPPAAADPREVRWSVVLFVASFVSVWVTSAWPAAAAGIETAWTDGLQFAAGLMAVLLAHEMGHYVVARRHGFALSPPWFLPLPLPPLGTLGAVIRLRSLPPSRTALLEMGAAGPLSGAVVAFTLLAVFLPHFRPTPADLPADAVYFNDPLVAKLLGLVLTGRVPPLDAVYHPVAYAGWAGCLVTGINLLPLGQLDGGHVFGALFPRRARLFSRLLLAGAVVGAWWNVGWLLWGFLVWMLGAWRPLPVPSGDPLTVRARWVAAAAVALFLLTFMPAPVVGSDLPTLFGKLWADLAGAAPGAVSG